jgi:hypothetical protein
VRRTLPPFTEIVVMRAPTRRDPDGHVGRTGEPFQAMRARSIEVLDGPPGRFTYRLVKHDDDEAGVSGSRAFENEGVTWAVGWDDETLVALQAAHALADHPRPVRDNPRTER